MKLVTEPAQLPLIEVEGKDLFTKIPNTIISTLWRKNLSAYESRVLWFIVRLTLGWHRPRAHTSARQIGRTIGAERKAVQRALNALKAKNIIEVKHTSGNQVGKGLLVGLRNVDKFTNITAVQGAEMTPVQGAEMTPVQGAEMTPARFLKQGF